MGIKKMRVLVALLVLQVASMALSRRVSRLLGRRMTATAFYVSNDNYNLALSNNGNVGAAGNPVVGWPWAGYNNQVWDLQVWYQTTYNAHGITKYSMRSYSPGNFVLQSTNRALTIESWTGHDNQAWEYDTRSRALRSFTDGKIDFGRGYTRGTPAHCDDTEAALGMTVKDGQSHGYTLQVLELGPHPNKIYFPVNLKIKFIE